MLKVIERSLWMLALVAAVYCGHLVLKAEWNQTRGSHELEHRDRLPARLQVGDVVGRLEIPRLGLSTVVFEGADSDVLDRGAGHLPGSALPGKKGNTVVAAHRDTFFRPLRNVRVGDEIHITGPSEDLVYVVESTTVVEPEDTYVLSPTPQPELTMITCFPFHFIGSAPDRFVVRAVLAR